MSKKYVYLFSEGNASMKNLLGGTGAGLAEMTGLNLPVPQGFTVTTEACIRYYEDGEKIAPDILEQIDAGMIEAEKLTARNSAISTIRCLYPFVRAREFPCRA
jgi:pyruvate,orthophosphate dikinase